MSDIEERIGLAYSKMGIREPFIAAVLAKVKREIMTTIPTAATNGSVVKYNPDFCAKQSDEQLFGLALHESCHVVLMHSWRRDGRDVAFVIGGADGLAPELKKDAGLLWSLSPLTLPHGLVRVILAEQLYRAASILTGHPYHRE